MPSALPSACRPAFLLLACGCAALPGPSASRETPPFDELWQDFQAGATRPFVSLGLFADYSTSIASDFVDEDDDPPELEVDLAGKFGGALGVERYNTEGVGVRAGVDFRLFSPGNPRAVGAEDLDQFFDFEDTTYYELFLAVRVLAAERASFAGGRLRPWLEGKLAWVPEISADSTFLFGLPGIPDPQFEFRGSAYWNFGAGAGLLYNWTPRTSLYLGFLYEWALTRPTDRVDLELEVSPGTVFTVPLDIELEPEGLIVFGGVTWSF